MRVRKKDFTYVSGKKYDLMMGRCYREKDKSYPYYGERGIRVCSNWIEDINNFRQWILNYLKNNNIDIDEFILKSKYYQLDRIDSNGHYTPENCKFSSPQQNTRNRRGNDKKIISCEGIEFTYKA